MGVDASLVGRTFPAGAAYRVSGERIAEFAAATGSRYDGGPAPATFPIVVAFQAMLALMADPSVGIALHRVVHGEQRFAHHRPIRTGDRLVATTTIDAARTVAGNDLLTARVDLTAEDGEAVCTATSMLVARGS